MPNFFADLGHGGPAITNALTDVTKTALTLEQMKGEKQAQAIRENTLRMQQFEYEKEAQAEKRRNQVLPINSVISTLRPEAQVGTELHKEMYGLVKGLGYIETIAGEEVISGRNIEAGVALFKGNEERFYTASLNDINKAITQLSQPTEKPLKPEEQVKVTQQLENLQARKVKIINAIKGEEQLRLEREQKIKEQEITAQKERDTEKFKADINLERVKGEEAIKLEREKIKTKGAEKLTDKKEKDIKHIEDVIDKYDKEIAAYDIKDNPLALDAIKPIKLKREQTIKKWEKLTGNKYPTLPKTEEPIEEDWMSSLSNKGKQIIQNMKDFYGR